MNWFIQRLKITKHSSHKSAKNMSIKSVIPQSQQNDFMTNSTRISEIQFEQEKVWIASFGDFRNPQSIMCRISLKIGLPVQNQEPFAEFNE